MCVIYNLQEDLFLCLWLFTLEGKPQTDNQPCISTCYWTELLMPFHVCTPEERQHLSVHISSRQQESLCIWCVNKCQRYSGWFDWGVAWENTPRCCRLLVISFVTNPLQYQIILASAPIVLRPLHLEESFLPSSPNYHCSSPLGISILLMQHVLTSPLPVLYTALAVLLLYGRGERIQFCRNCNFFKINK